MIRRGDVVRLKPEWQDKGDDMIVFIALEDEDGGRVLIEAQVDMKLKPTQRVRTDMLESQPRPTL